MEPPKLCGGHFLGTQVVLIIDEGVLIFWVSTFTGSIAYNLCSKGGGARERGLEGGYAFQLIKKKGFQVAAITPLV